MNDLCNRCGGSGERDTSYHDPVKGYTALSEPCWDCNSGISKRDPVLFRVKRDPEAAMAEVVKLIEGVHALPII